MDMADLILKDTAAARRRVVHALKALTEYVNKPSSEPHNQKVYDYLARELRKATDAYDTLLLIEATQKMEALDEVGI
jgi:hypothetical protein